MVVERWDVLRPMPTGVKGRSGGKRVLLSRDGGARFVFERVVLREEERREVSEGRVGCEGVDGVGAGSDSGGVSSV